MYDIVSSILVVAILGLFLAGLVSTAVQSISPVRCLSEQKRPERKYAYGMLFFTGLLACFAALFSPDFPVWAQIQIGVGGTTCLVLSAWAFLKLWEEKWIRNCVPREQAPVLSRARAFVRVAETVSASVGEQFDE